LIMSRRREFFDAGSVEARRSPSQPEREEGVGIRLSEGYGIGYSVQTGSGGALVFDRAAGSEGGAVVSRTDDRPPVRLETGDPAFFDTQEREMSNYTPTEEEMNEALAVAWKVARPKLIAEARVRLTAAALSGLCANGGLREMIPTHAVRQADACIALLFPPEDV
jgi:hypothetical protein